MRSRMRQEEYDRAWVDGLPEHKRKLKLASSNDERRMSVSNENRLGSHTRTADAAAVAVYGLLKNSC